MLNPALLVPAHTSLLNGSPVLTSPMKLYFSPWNHWMSFPLQLESRCFIITGFPSARTFPLMMTDVQQNAGTMENRSRIAVALNFLILNTFI